MLRAMNALRVVEDSIRRSILSKRCLIVRTSVQTYVVHNGGKDPEFISSVKPPPVVTDEVVVDPPIPAYVDKLGETVDTMRARLIYQSRKRGTLENGLLLSTFASQYLSSFSTEQLLRYDRLINKPSNDWDIYYWMVGTREPPAEFNNDVMVLLKEHAKNKNNESRICQPDLKA